jgi:hypothetical protein
MKTKVIAAALLFAANALFAQAPNVAGGINVPTRTPTRTGGPAPASVTAPPVLHLDGHITSLGCEE